MRTVTIAVLTERSESVTKKKDGSLRSANKRREDVGDSMETIQQCLNCTRPTCINCIDFKKKDYKALDLSKLSIERQREFINLYMECSSDAELSKRYGRASSFVCTCRHAFDLPAYRSSTPEERKYCAEMVLNGLST